MRVPIICKPRRGRRPWPRDKRRRSARAIGLSASAPALDGRSLHFGPDAHPTLSESARCLSPCPSFPPVVPALRSSCPPATTYRLRQRVAQRQTPRAPWPYLLLPSTPTRSTTSRRLRIVRRIAEFMWDHAGEAIHMSQLCRAVGVSRTQPAHACNAACGTSPTVSSCAGGWRLSATPSRARDPEATVTRIATTTASS